MSTSQNYLGSQCLELYIGVLHSTLNNYKVGVDPFHLLQDGKWEYKYETILHIGEMDADKGRYLRMNACA